jgi:hypothetical protein
MNMLEIKWHNIDRLIPCNKTLLYLKIRIEFILYTVTIETKRYGMCWREAKFYFPSLPREGNWRRLAEA